MRAIGYWFRIPALSGGPASLRAGIGGGRSRPAGTRALQFFVGWLTLTGCSLASTSPSLTPPASPLSIPPGEVIEFSAQLNAEMQRLAGASGGKGDIAEARCAVAVPADFSPERAWPVLLVSATSDPGYNSSRALLRQFAPPALRAGWIVIAADPPREVGVAADTDALRYALLAAALERLQAGWPGLARWPRAFGGFSGGAKHSALLGAFSLLLGHPPIGIYQAGCNQATMRTVLTLSGLPRDRFLATPVFLSSGRQDRIAPPDVMEDVADELTSAGFRTVKLEHFAGDHEVYTPHIETALRWFAKCAEHPPEPAPR